MSFSENLSTFAGKRVEDWDAEGRIDDPQAVAYRVRISYGDDESWVDRFQSLLDDPKVGQLDALVVGQWTADTGTDSEAVIEALVAARDKLASLTHLFLGDITSEECEISWIRQSDLAPLLEAYPRLAHLTVRGGEALAFGSPRHEALRELVVQAGGLPPGVVHEIAGADFPNLEHLELYLGEPNYGGDATVEDLAPLLRGERFPRLRYLGLKDSLIQDEIAGVVALAPVVQRLKVLDLSLGTLGDDGARALLASPAVAKLEKLDLHHHYVSDELAEQLRKLGPEVDLSDKREPDEWGGEQHRYIAVSE